MLPKIRSTLKHTAIILLLCFLLPWPISSASVYEEKDSAINYTMSYPMVYLDHNQEAQDRINSDIYNYISAFKADYYDGKFMNGSFKYEVKYEDDDVLSLMIIDYRYYGGAHGLEKGIGLNYSKKTGQRLPLPYFVRLRPDDASEVFSLPIYNWNNKQLFYNTTKDFVKYTRTSSAVPTIASLTKPSTAKRRLCQPLLMETPAPSPAFIKNKPPAGGFTINNINLTTRVI